jgi:galactose oxidase-like protein/Big-like domain-containing protein/IPT/TIG domain-containing protein/3-keto-disaccharide hydrolase/Kelch motif protein
MQHETSFNRSLLKALSWTIIAAAMTLASASGAYGQAISRISPTAGSTAGGGSLDVLGSSLAGTTSVTIGGNSAVVLSAAADGSKVIVRVPAGTAGPADLTLTAGGNTTTLSRGYTYLNSSSVLFADDFNTGSLANWSASPLGLFANWTGSNDVADYNGGGHTQIFAGSGSWTDYTVQAKFQLFSGNNYPGGLRGRVDLATGAAYAAWIYPANSTIKLFRTTGWNIDSPGLALIAQAGVPAISANVFHTLQMTFSGAKITIALDGASIIQVSDPNLSSGAIALDVSNQHIQFDDVLVTTTPVDTIPPTVSLTSPANGATVTGTISVAASAADNTGVAGVQFLLDGASLGAEVTTAPYTFSWNTTASSNGAHVLSARARDMSGNTATAGNIAVTVSNVVAPTLTGVALSPATISLPPGGTQQLSFTAQYSNGSTQDVTANAQTTYSSSNTGAATVSSGGLVTAGSAGSSTITAQFGGMSATATLAVNANAPTIARISATAGPATGGSRLDIIGTNLSSSTVQVGGQAAPVIASLPDGTRISVTTPAEASGQASVVVSNGGGSATLTNGYKYVDPTTILFTDDFNSASLSRWTASPLGLFANWSAAGDLADYNGGGHTQIYAGSGSWTDYTVETKFQLFSSNNYPGGLRGRVDPVSGTSYAAWLYPATSTIKLFRTGGWNIDSPGLAVLAQAPVSGITPNVFHVLALTFSGAQISVSFDGASVIQVTDAGLAQGAIALDVSSQRIQFEDVLVTRSVPDTTAPTVSITSPANGASVAGAISVAASASDNVQVAGVQFLLDGANLGAELTSAPYTVSWNTATASNGAHTLSARARDAAGNAATAASITVTVANAPPPSLTGITIAPGSFNMSFVGAQQPLTVTARYSDGSTKNVTGSSAFSSNNPQAASVTGGGVVTALNNGTATISANYSGDLATATVVVRLDPPLIERISARAGAANGGARVDLIGNNLSSNTTITIGGSNAPVVAALPDGSQITVLAPSGTIGPADVVASNTTGTATVRGGYRYLDPASVLFADDFNAASLSNWTASPLGLFSHWSATGDVANYDGSGHTQISAGSASWTDYSVRAVFQLFNVTNYPGGLRGRVNLSSGASYEAWLLPSTAQIKLYRTTGWSIDTAGLALLAQAPVPYLSPNEFHTLEMIFNGPRITVLLDGPAVLQFNDSMLTSGGIALDVSNQQVQFDDVLVTSIPVDTVAPAISLTAPAPGGTVAGSTTLSATASDNVGVAGVQFLLDGVFFGPEQTVSPYQIAWNTANAVNGQHTLTAMARDASGNVTTSAPVTVTVANNYIPSADGQWTAPFTWPIVAINLSVLKTGEVISWDGPPADGGSSATLWSPATGNFTAVPNTSTNMFCNGMVQLSDGRLFAAGGHADWGVGLTDSDIYDPVTRLWTKMSSMSFGRWYPTLTTLPDGRVLAISGSDRCETCPVPTPEVYDPVLNTWNALTNASLSLPLYPFMFVLPDGRVLEAGSVGSAIPTQVLDVNTQHWTMVDPDVVDGHSAVMYQPGKVMKSGTASTPNISNMPAQPVTFVLDMTQTAPKWQQTAPMSFPRSYQNLTLLPDGAVLATGGESTQDGTNYANSVLPAEIWSPATQSWATLAPEQTGRLYHSSAVLLLDGRVLVAGSGRAGPAPQFNAEIFSPPYLFKGPRPTISSAPSRAGYGSTFFVGTPDASGISGASLIRLSTATHSFNMDQRFLNLTFQVTGGGLNIQAPANANLAPPGFYVLFIMNGNGVPAVAAVIQLQ